MVSWSTRYQRRPCTCRAAFGTNGPSPRPASIVNVAQRFPAARGLAAISDEILTIRTTSAGGAATALIIARVWGMARAKRERMSQDSGFVAAIAEIVIDRRQSNCPECSPEKWALENLADLKRHTCTQFYSLAKGGPQWEAFSEASVVWL
jgi:hypothetical protein